MIHIARNCYEYLKIKNKKHNIRGNLSKKRKEKVCFNPIQEYNI